jgi:hypothetical protein
MTPEAPSNPRSSVFNRCVFFHGGSSFATSATGALLSQDRRLPQVSLSSGPSNRKPIFGLLLWKRQEMFVGS